MVGGGGGGCARAATAAGRQGGEMDGTDAGGDQCDRQNAGRNAVKIERLVLSELKTREPADAFRT